MRRLETSRLPEPIRRHLETVDARTPVEQVRGFLRGHVAAATDLDEVLRDLHAVASVSTLGLRRDLRAMVAVTTATLPDGALAKLVAWDGNRVLDDPTDAGARAFLEGVAETIRDVVARAEAEPRPRSDDPV